MLLGLPCIRRKAERAMCAELGRLRHLQTQDRDYQKPSEAGPAIENGASETQTETEKIQCGQGW